MRQYLAIFFLSLSFFSGVQAKEITFAFHGDLPSGIPKAFRFLYSLKPINQKEIRADVDIPGLPVVRNQRMVYVVYAQPEPNGWEGAMIAWYDRVDCSIMDIHVAIRDKSDNLPILYNELFQLGFRRAVMRENVDLCGAEKQRKQPLLFLYGGRQWSHSQLEEAASEIGTMRAAKKIGRPELIQSRFREVSMVDVEQYRLIHFLVKRANGDPKKYEAELKLVVESFLDRHRPKK